MNKKFKLFSIIIMAIVCGGCKKFVDVPGPSTSISSLNVFEDDATAASALTGIYTNLSSATITSGGITSMSYFTGLSSDELKLFSATAGSTVNIAYYTNSLSATNLGTTNFWSKIYPIIYDANTAIEGINASSTLTPQVKKQLLGEAKFIRAFCYFYLVNLYGDVPLALSTDFTANAVLIRSSSDAVYNQIFSDLKEAQNLLTDQYVAGDAKTQTAERTRPNKWAATSLLARAYLFHKDYANAANESASVISNSLFKLESITNVFLANSNEAIWQLQPVAAGQNTKDAVLFHLPATGPNTSSFPTYLSNDVINRFEPGDQRKDAWTGNVTAKGITYYYPYKYKVYLANSPVTEYTMVMRLAEQYLIRAEAKIQQGDISSGISDLNTVRKRSRLPITVSVPNPLPDLSLSLSKNDAMQAVVHERQTELFTEWGARWLDLKRLPGFSNAANTLANEIMPAVKGTNWQTTDQLYPIPQTEIDRNPNLKGHQNPGY